jgi:D-inositol-3-phosphate glycosyltransferase
LQFVGRTLPGQAAHLFEVGGSRLETHREAVGHRAVEVGLTPLQSSSLLTLKTLLSLANNSFPIKPMLIPCPGVFERVTRSKGGTTPCRSCKVTAIMRIKDLRMIGGGDGARKTRISKTTPFAGNSLYFLTMTSSHFFPIGSCCSSTVWGGLEMNVLRFLMWMRERGWPVFLYANPDTVLAQHAFEASIPVRGVKVTSELSALLEAGKLARLIDTDHVSHLILHQSRDLLVCALAKRRSGRDLKLIFSQNMHLGNKRDLLHAWQYRRLDAFVAPLPILAEQARKQTVVPPEKIKIIPHGIDQSKFATRLEQRFCRLELGLPVDAQIIGIIGRLDPKKGQHTGIKALGRCHEKGFRAHLLIVGNPTLHENDKYEGELHTLVSQHHLEEFVHFRPYVEKPEVAYGAMDIFVLPSHSETYGLVTIEAMTCGLPVIGTDSGGTIDLIDDKKSGLRFPYDDDAALADRLMQFLGDASYAAKLAAQGRADALARYSHVKQCESWENLLRFL